MKIGIVGVGNIGKTLVQKLSTAGHDVKAANSRGPETIDRGVFANGGRGVSAEEAVQDVGVVILAMPHSGFEKIRDQIVRLPEKAVVIDTSNYFAARDGENSEIEAGKTEGVWVQEFFGRPISKAWNTIYMECFTELGLPKGHPERIALPVSGVDPATVMSRWR